MRARRSGVLGVAALAVGAAGCVSVLPDSGPAPEIYRLSAPEPDQSGAPAAAADLTIEVPTPIAPKALANDRIALVDDGGRVAYVAGARWAAPTPRLLQALVLETIENGEGVGAAVRPEDGVAAPYELRLEILAFDGVADGQAARAAHVRVRARLVDNRARTLVGSRVFSRREPTASTGRADLVAAFDAAVGGLAIEIRDWTLEKHAAATDARPPAASPSAA